MRVLFAITLGEVGGAQEHLRILASGLVARGYQVGVAVSEPSPLATRLRDHGIEVLAWKSIVREPSLRRDVRARAELRHIVDRFRPDVLHLYSAKAGVLGRGLPGDHRTIYTCHHAPFGPRRQWSHRLVARPIEQLTLRRVDGIISDGARDMPLLRKLAPTTPIKLVRNAVPLDDKVVPPASTEHTALWVARLARPKAPLEAIAAWEHVVRAVPDARLLVCGTGPLADEVAAQVARSPARHQIDVLGRVDDLEPLYARSSIFLLTTAVEGGSTMATLEAMGRGLVPVISDAGDAFLYEHARCGVVVQPHAPKAVAGAIVSLWRDPPRMSAMRDRALDFARKDWTVDDLVGATTEFYDAIRGAA
jgi:glycosyltransferase involved in cell wall biosynthesis